MGWAALAAVGLVGVAGLVVNLWLRWKLSEATARAEEAQTTATNLTKELLALQAARRDELAMELGVTRVLRASESAERERSADLVRRHPGLADEYLRDSLQVVAASEADDRALPSLPRPAAAEDGEAGPGKR